MTKFVFPIPDLTYNVSQIAGTSITPTPAANLHVIDSRFWVANDLETNTPTLCFGDDVEEIKISYIDENENEIAIDGQPQSGFVGPRPPLPPTY